MAILKHIASKNANYGSAIDYLKYQHDEFHLVPILDENGNMMLRDEFYLEGLNCDPETFDLECELLNQEYNKNNTYDEIKSHHYIISHDPRDNADHDLTGERAQAIGLEYAKANFPGHQALVCTHTDGNNSVVTHCPCCTVRRRIQDAAGVWCSICTQTVDFQRIAIVQPPRHRSAADSNAHQRTIFRYADGKLMSSCRLMVAVILLYKCVCRFQIDRC